MKNIFDLDKLDNIVKSAINCDNKNNTIPCSVYLDDNKKLKIVKNNVIIVVCGKSGSGKSTLALELKKIYGNRLIHCDIDKIGHCVYDNPEVLKKLINCFGENVIENNGVNRKKLRELVFNSKKEMDKLTNITWKYMEIEIDRIINNNKNKIIVLDWILLPKTKYFNLADINILLDIPYEVRKKRAMERDNITNDDFELREKASIDYDENKFDYVLKSSSEIKKVKIL